MDKASRALKRSGAKLLSLGGTHGDLSVLLAGLKEIKNTTKSLIDSQSVATQDLIKWASKQENRAIQDVVSQIGELQLVWVEVQKALLDQMRDYRNMFDLILQGEKKVAQAKENMEYCDQKEIKARKDLKKAAKRESSTELRMLHSRLAMAEDSKNAAQIEVSDSVRENESVKLIRLKKGLIKMSTAYVEVGNKCSTLYTGQRAIAEQMPDVHGTNLENVRYTGSRTVRAIAQQTMQQIQGYRESQYPSGPSAHDDPPPPYVPPGPESIYQQPETVRNNNNSCREPGTRRSYSPAVAQNGNQQRRLSQPPQPRSESPATMQITNIVRIQRRESGGSSDSSLSRSSSVNLCEGQVARGDSPCHEGIVRATSGSRGSLQESGSRPGSRCSDEGQPVCQPEAGESGRPMPLPRRKHGSTPGMGTEVDGGHNTQDGGGS